MVLNYGGLDVTLYHEWLKIGLSTVEEITW